MAGKPKRGIDYAGWDAHIFDDDSVIDELIVSQGWVGFSIYFYLCQKAYATDGYFYRWSYSNSATTARRMGGGVRSETIKQVVGLCLRIGLFDNRLFEEEGLLTSKNIQERYMLAIENRSESGRTVDPKIWLLNSDETKPYIVIPENKHSLPENGDSLSENATKESKVKKRKVKESIINTVSPSGSAVQSQAEEVLAAYHRICRSYPTVMLKDSHIADIAESLKEYQISDFEKAFGILEGNGFLKGGNDKHWKAQFGWAVKAENMRKLLSGCYDRHEPVEEKSPKENDIEKYKFVINRF